MRTFERCGVYGVGVLTAMVAQSPGSVSHVQALDVATVRAQFREISGAFPIASAKTGMLASCEIVEEAARFFAEHPRIPLVVDPVMRASAGASLTGPSALQLAARRLFPRASLITPNLDEAEALLGRKILGGEDFAAAAAELGERYGTAVLLKGGHAPAATDEVGDCFYQEGKSEWMAGTKLSVPDLHGTGCALSALITAQVARGQGLRESVLFARDTLRQWMAGFYQWQAGERRTFALNSGL